MPGKIARLLILPLVCLMLILTVAVVRPSLPSHAAHPTPSTSTNWSQAGFDQPHTSFNPNEHVLTTSNVSRLTLDWAFLSPFTHPLVASSPVVVNGVVYAGFTHGYHGTFYALNAASGAVIWSHAIPDRIEGGAAVSNGIVYFNSLTRMYALNAANGSLIWVVAPTLGGTYPAFPFSPTLVGNILYFTTTSINNKECRLYAINARTGAMLWTFLPAHSPYSAAAVANGMIYFGGVNGYVYAVNAQTGKQVWSFVTGDIVTASPAVANGMVYIGSDDHKVYAFNAQSGALLWRETTGGIIGGWPAVANGVVYVGSMDGMVYAFDAATGAKRWTAAISPNAQSGAAVANGVVYVGAEDGNLYAFNATSGKRLLVSSAGAEVGEPVVVNGMVYFDTALDGKIVALHLPG